MTPDSSPEQYPALFECATKELHSLGDATVFVVGRNQAADLPLLDVRCSRRQFQVVRREDGFFIEPLSAKDADRERLRLRGQFGVAGQTSVLLFVAHNFKLKGLAELIAALGELPRGDWLLLVAGKGEAGLYRRMADRLFLGSCRRLCDPQPAGDILLHPGIGWPDTGQRWLFHLPHRLRAWHRI